MSRGALSEIAAVQAWVKTSCRGRSRPPAVLVLATNPSPIVWTSHLVPPADRVDGASRCGGNEDTCSDEWVDLKLPHGGSLRS